MKVHVHLKIIQVLLKAVKYNLTPSLLFNITPNHHSLKTTVL